MHQASSDRRTDYQFKKAKQRKASYHPERPCNEPVVRGQRVLTVGHSFHVFIAQFLPEIARSAGIRGHSTVGTHFLGGSRVVEHWEQPDLYNGAKRALRSGGVDVLTLSPIFHPDVGIERFTRLAVEHNPSIRVTVQASWVPFDGVLGANLYPGRAGRDALTPEALRQLHEPYFQSVDEEIVSLNRDYDRPILAVVPVGPALLRLRELIHLGKAPGLRNQEELFLDPLGHPALPVQLLASYAHFAVIYRRDPIGLPAPTILRHGKKSDEGESLNRLLQELAWQAVLDHRLSGVCESAN